MVCLGDFLETIEEVNTVGFVRLGGIGKQFKRRLELHILRELFYEGLAKVGVVWHLSETAYCGLSEERTEVCPRLGGFCDCIIDDLA